jgi:hypothetical protein
VFTGIDRAIKLEIKRTVNKVAEMFALFIIRLLAEIFYINNYLNTIISLTRKNHKYKLSI